MRSSLWLLGSVTVVACGRPASPPASAPAQAALADSLAAVTRRFAETTHVPGLAVGIWRGDSLVYQAGLGVTVLPGGGPVTPSTLFHMASVTKPFVATGIMQLVEQGKVALDQPVTTYLPYFKMRDPRARTITIRQLLSHIAGMPDVTDYRWNHPEYDDGALDRYVRELKDSTLIAAPAAIWRYSNIGFEVLAAVIATVSGQPFEAYVQQHILTPLGMTKSTLLMTDIDSTLMAYGHSTDSTGVYHRNADYPYNRRHAASSTLHSNVADMLRWARANLGRGELDGARILQDSSYRSMWTPARDITVELMARAKQAGITLPYDSMAMGLSWFLPVGGGRRMVNHSGGDEGFRTDLLLVPDERIGIVVLLNGDGGNPSLLSRALLDAIPRSAGRP